MLKVSAKLNASSLDLMIEGEVVRSISNPISGNSYKFKYNGEDYYFVYEETERTKKIFLYPLNDFEANEIIITDN